MSIKTVDFKFIKVVKAIASQDEYDFSMWGSDADGNVGLTVHGKKGRQIDISQMMSATGRTNEDGTMETIAKGISVEYCENGRYEYEEERDIDRIINNIFEFLNGNSKPVEMELREYCQKYNYGMNRVIGDAICCLECDYCSCNKIHDCDKFSEAIADHIKEPNGQNLESIKIMVKGDEV